MRLPWPFCLLQDLAADLAQITFDYPFRIPPYFALVIRAIGVPCCACLLWSTGVVFFGMLAGQ